MDISVKQLKGKPKKIGSLRGNPVFYLATKGGWAMVIERSGKGVKVLGASPHKGISKFQAKKREPELEFDELSKNEDLPLESFKHLLPEFDKVVDSINSKL